MSIVLNLPPELESELAVEAAQIGLALPEYAVRLLVGTRLSQIAPRTGHQLIAYWQNEGLIGARPEIDDPSAHARQLRDQAQRRTRP